MPLEIEIRNAPVGDENCKTSPVSKLTCSIEIRNAPVGDENTISIPSQFAIRTLRLGMPR